MNHECPPLDRIEDLAALDAGDPRRIQTENCPRCHARLAAFAAFMDMHPLPEGIRLEEARARLSSAVSREIEGASRRGFSIPDVFSWLRLRPLLRPALGVASLLLIAAVLVRVSPDRGADSVPVLRDAGVTQVTGTQAWSEQRPGGAILFTWRPVPEAETYRVEFYGTTLVEALEVEAGSDTTLFLGRDRLVQLGVSGTALFWRVAALRSGDPVSVSPPRTIHVP